MAEELKDEIVEAVEEFEEDGQKGMFMTFQTGKEYYGISISYVNEIITMQPITAIPEVENYIKGLINLRGKIIPVIDVRARVKMEPQEYVKSTVIGLIVEKIAEVDSILEDDIMPPPALSHKNTERNKYIYGLARTGNTVKLLLEPERLIQQDVLNVIEDIKEKEQS